MSTKEDGLPFHTVLIQPFLVADNPVHSILLVLVSKNTADCVCLFGASN